MISFVFTLTDKKKQKKPSLLSTLQIKKILKIEFLVAIWS